MLRYPENGERCAEDVISLGLVIVVLNIRSNLNLERMLALHSLINPAADTALVPTGGHASDKSESFSIIRASVAAKGPVTGVGEGLTSCGFAFLDRVEAVEITNG